MENILVYILKSFIVSGILTAYYFIALRNTRLHTLNRFYIVFTLLATIIFPFFRFQWLAVQETAIFSGFTRLFAEDTNQLSPGVAILPTAFNWLVALFAVTSMALLVMLISKIIWIYRVKRGHQVVKMDGFNFIEIPLQQAPFTFFNNLFWKKGLNPNEGSTNKILQHELAHIKGKHTYDKLFAQTCTCLFWMNPFIWIIKKELTMVHEFIADAGSIKKGDLNSFARMLLTAYNNGKYLAPQHSFFQSPIKRRIHMLTNNQTPRLLLLRKVLVIPVILGTAITIGCSKSKNNTQQQLPAVVAQQEKPAAATEAEKGAIRVVETIIPDLQNQPLDTDPGKEKIIMVKGSNQKSEPAKFKVTFDKGPVISAVK